MVFVANRTDDFFDEVMGQATPVGLEWRGRPINFKEAVEGLVGSGEWP